MSSRKRGRDGGSGSSRNEIVRLNVGGEIFITRKSTLQAVSDSLLGKMFEDDSPYGEPEQDGDGNIFLDRDPASFRVILNYLRRGKLAAGANLSTALLLEVQADADFFCLTDLSEACESALEGPDQHTCIGAHFRTLAETIDGVGNKLVEVITDTAGEHSTAVQAAERMADAAETVATLAEELDPVIERKGILNSYKASIRTSQT